MRVRLFLDSSTLAKTQILNYRHFPGSLTDGPASRVTSKFLSCQISGRQPVQPALLSYSATSMQSAVLSKRTEKPAEHLKYQDYSKGRRECAANRLKSSRSKSCPYGSDPYHASLGTPPLQTFLFRFAARQKSWAGNDFFSRLDLHTCGKQKRTEAVNQGGRESEPFNIVGLLERLQTCLTLSEVHSISGERLVVVVEAQSHYNPANRSTNKECRCRTCFFRAKHRSLIQDTPAATQRNTKASK